MLVLLKNCDDVDLHNSVIISLIDLTRQDDNFCAILIQKHQVYYLMNNYITEIVNKGNVERRNLVSAIDVIINLVASGIGYRDIIDNPPILSLALQLHSNIIHREVQEHLFSLFCTIL